jgi:NAD dependent epimerase/dehydratase family enzyme
MAKTILITGGSGLLGTYLTSFFSDRGYAVRQLGRGNKGKEAQGLFYWNPEKNEIDAEALRGVDVLIHLAGETVAGKAWTAERKQRILDSRIQSTRLLIDTINSSGYKPGKVIAASATGYYGAVTRDVIFTEPDPAGTDFLAQVCGARRRCLGGDGKTHAFRFWSHTRNGKAVGSLDSHCRRGRHHDASD